MTTKKYIQLPRGYLSQSQVSLWLSSPKRYADIYFDSRDELRPQSAAMDYGKIIADALEKDEQTGDLLSDSAMLLLPKYDIRDKEFRSSLKTTTGWVEILAKPDFMDSETKNFIEIKTGKTVWTQAKVEKALQIKWYATAIYLAHGVIPKARLAWVETSWSEDGTVVPTGRIEEFAVEFTMSEILDTLVLMGRVALEIQAAYAAHVPDPRVTTF